MNEDARQLLSLLSDQGPRLHALLYRITLRQDVCDDLLQELFLRLHRRSSFASADDQVAYAITAATRLAFDWRRAERRRRDKESLIAELAAPSSSAPCPLEEREDLRHTLDAIDRLPEASRTIIVMRYLQGWPYDEIARMIHRSVHQTRALCHKAILRLRAEVARRQPAQALDVRHEK